MTGAITIGDVRSSSYRSALRLPLKLLLSDAERSNALKLPLKLLLSDAERVASDAIITQPDGPHSGCTSIAVMGSAWRLLLLLLLLPSHGPRTVLLVPAWSRLPMRPR